jgi:hypothetical protein
MNEKEVFKKALKTAFLKEILCKQLVEAKIINEDSIYIDNEGKITLNKNLFQTGHGQDTIGKLINELASRLADVSVELRLKTEKDKKVETQTDEKE